ncbi:4-oxalocrotonate tautomerase [Thermoflavimicrobium dichotomicum]|uniref:Tautomerase n=2 Tax=Thermoflavimicrobium dichotomicum TaxID=46223 RepID=A0A1I3RD34_9BACL|nr:4-oxalocrotonate tautomerase [Thermoflavimicrobium dichotomicum]
MMPLAQIHILEGRTPEQKKKMITEVTAALVNSLDVQPENVRVVIYEVPKSHWSIGGMTMEEREKK